MSETRIPETQLIEDMQRVAENLDRKEITIAEYEEHGKFGSSAISKRLNVLPDDAATSIDPIEHAQSKVPLIRGPKVDRHPFSVSEFLIPYPHWVDNTNRRKHLR